MKRLLGLALPLTLVGCAHMHIDLGHAFDSGTKGNGKVEESSRIVGEYDKVEVGSAFKVEATEGKLTPVKVSADSNLLAQIKTEVKDRTLKVWIDGSISSQSPFKITLSTPTIHAMKTSGAAEVNLKLASVHDLELGGSGASKVNVVGTVSSLVCDLSGASQAKVPSSKLSKADLSLSGSSNLTIAGTVDQLTADLSGASSIEGGLSGRQATLKLSGASSGSFGSFENVTKDISGSSNATFGKG